MEIKTFIQKNAYLRRNFKMQLFFTSQASPVSLLEAKRWLKSQLLLKKHYHFKRLMTLSASKDKNPINFEIISVLKNNIQVDIMNDPSIQKLLKHVDYSNFKLSPIFSEQNLKSEISNYKQVVDLKGMISLFNNENSLYHRLCKSILQAKNQTLTCIRVETYNQGHHVQPLHLKNNGLITEEQLDQSYNIIHIPIEFHYFFFTRDSCCRILLIKGVFNN